MQARQEEIRSSLEAAEDAKTEADEARAQRQGIIDEARPAGERDRRPGQPGGRPGPCRRAVERTAGIRAARSERRCRDSARAQRALDEITSRIGALVLSVARQVIEREIDAQRHRALIDEAVSALRAEAAATGAASPGPGTADGANPADGGTVA